MRYRKPILVSVVTCKFMTNKKHVLVNPFVLNVAFFFLHDQTVLVKGLRIEDRVGHPYIRDVSKAGMVG